MEMYLIKCLKELNEELMREDISSNNLVEIGRIANFIQNAKTCFQKELEEILKMSATRTDFQIAFQKEQSKVNKNGLSFGKSIEEWCDKVNDACIDKDSKAEFMYRLFSEATSDKCRQVYHDKMEQLGFEKRCFEHGQLWNQANALD